jgi:pimeloyl-ACP methyl ester carboxylesterase
VGEGAGAAVMVVLLVLALAQPAAANVETATINGAAFRIEMPAAWNKGLIMYAHGYQPTGTKVDLENARNAPFRQIFLSRGFAYAESAYSAQSWAVKEGLEDTEALRRYFVAKHGRPAETYIVGHSMGGHITIATIERYPEAYDGAMPMCGPLGAGLDFFDNGLFDMLVTFEALFPDTIGDITERRPGVAGRIKAALATDPPRAERYAARWGRSVADLPLALPLFNLIASELKTRAGGQPFDNQNKVYSGFGDDAAVNRTVKRYTGDPAAREYLRQYFTPTGRISDPVLALHAMADPLVLGEDVAIYATLAAIAGNSDKFVLRFSGESGHCSFTMEQTANAFDALRAWAKGGQKPAAGEQK